MCDPHYIWLFLILILSIPHNFALSNLENLIVLLVFNKINKAIIFGIESRIDQVIANLLDNSVSFSPSNAVITINLFMDKNTYKILIKDQGPGFDENNLDKVFERFYSDRPDDREGSHSGLGLNIVKNIIDSHKGLIKVYNKLDGDGAVVDITLPSV